ncbi:MAG: molybdopterin molybdotransferase MoeA [Verrucomicrobiota bacterium]
MISYQEALTRVLEAASPLPPEYLSLEQSLHYALLETVTAPEDLPPFDRSAMDGYAIAEATNTHYYSVVGEIHAGDPVHRALVAGECVRIATGGHVPEGANRVIPKELAQEAKNGKRVQFSKGPNTSFIRSKGEDCKKGAVLLEEGQLLMPTDLALLASIGHTLFPVIERPKIAHLTTGDEVVPPSEAPQAGQIRNSNGILVQSFLQSHHFDLVQQAHLGDDEAQIAEWISTWQSQAHVLLISGGASVGPKDFAPDLLKTSGYRGAFSRVAIRPGKPVFFGYQEDHYAFVLPGNPGSHLAILRLLVLPLLQKLAGRAPSDTLVKAQLSETGTYRPDSRETFLPGHLISTGNDSRVSIPQWQSSGDVVSFAQANVLVRIPEEQEVPPAGTFVECLPLYPA